jgi:hypothetical protein
MSRNELRRPTTPEEYFEHGLGTLPSHADPRDLYLDAIRRSLTNILYEDRPAFIYGRDKQFKHSEHFDLRSRVFGEDFPLLAHTMVGIKRLENIQKCLTDVLESQVPGDIVEAGVLRGGAAIFARAVLKAYGVTDRRVLACDTFPDPAQRGVGRMIAIQFIGALTYIPSANWRRKLFGWLQSKVREKRFPDSLEPSDELINLNFWLLRNMDFNRTACASLEHVKSYFARYGLLDDQVVFVRGFFSETLDDATVGKIALLRLDADIYESTRDALTLLYPKLSPGGYCIIDDYHLADCRRATDEYRAQHSIREPFMAIDDLSVYWKKEESRHTEFVRTGALVQVGMV